MKHGANIYKYAKEIGCDAKEVIDFSSNINLYQPKTTLDPDNEMIVKYADTSYMDLRKSIAKNYPVKKSQIALYNGATSAIFDLLNTLDLDKVYLYAPLYGEYENALPKHVNKIKINRFKNINLIPQKNSTLVFVNPSTPDGKYYDLKKLFKIWKKQNCQVILDESFLEFETLKSFVHEINNYQKLYIIQSFSKFYACAGVRIGAVFSHKKNLKKLKQPIWNISSFDASFLTQRLNDKAFVKHSKKYHSLQKKELKNILESSNLFSKIHQSDSNFFLVKTKHAKALFTHLLHYKILVRTCGSFDFLSNKYLRFAIKDKQSHTLLKKALKEFHE